MRTDELLLERIAVCVTWVNCQTGKGGSETESGQNGPIEPKRFLSLTQVFHRQQALHLPERKQSVGDVLGWNKVFLEYLCLVDSIEWRVCKHASDHLGPQSMAHCWVRSDVVKLNSTTFTGQLPNFVHPASIYGSFHNHANNRGEHQNWLQSKQNTKLA